MNPSAVINRWVAGILLFDFELVHVPGITHGPDGLSRRRPQPGDPPPQGDDPDWVDKYYSFLHTINPYPDVRASGQKILSPVQIFAKRTKHPLVQNPIPSSTQINIPCDRKALAADARLDQVQKFLSDLSQPPDLSDDQLRTFANYASEFFLKDDELWKRDPAGEHKLVIPPARRYNILRIAHDELGHKGVYSVRQHILKCYWWPHMLADVKWFVKTCHLCQIRQTEKWHIPPVVAHPAPLFSKVYIDTFHLPQSNGFKYIVHARCSLSAYPEFRMLRKENAVALAHNGPAFLAALEILKKQYDIHHITISPYNSQAQGVIERRHYDFREALFKAADGLEKNWSYVAYSVIWAERVTPLRTLGRSPYEVATGVPPVLPLDIVEASFLTPPPASALTTTELIARRAVVLQKREADLEAIQSKVYEARVKAVKRWEKDHASRIIDWKFKQGALVLICNTRVEYELNRKFKPRYLGPLVVISRNQGGAYILAELDGTLLAQPVAAFRCIPYYARASIDIPDLTQFLDVDPSRVEDLERTVENFDDNI
ncbi:uncharacterized protein ARMOST_02948 [Armillaria ostoyae]|uniref:Integrase catalytic domain-containing protein n=1 Tax=Armillaria ostoyae TaxID=47428 RepID=A0A284QT44_ARMOS|nr:uncharacterized protein ARMOST_02948 [Armillaria ostoyae]